MKNKLYMVILYVDECVSYEYGLDDNYYLIGIFDDKNIAESVREKEEMKMKNDERFNYIEVGIREVELNKVYDSREFYIGGGFYVE